MSFCFILWITLSFWRLTVAKLSNCYWSVSTSYTLDHHFLIFTTWLVRTRIFCVLAVHCDMIGNHNHDWFVIRDKLVNLCVWLFCESFGYEILMLNEKYFLFLKPMTDLKLKSLTSSHDLRSVWNVLAIRCGSSNGYLSQYNKIARFLCDTILDEITIFSRKNASSILPNVCSMILRAHLWCNCAKKWWGSGKTGKIDHLWEIN